MNDQERLAAFLDRVKSVDGLDEQRFQRLTAELERAAGGISTQGGNTGEHQIKGLNPKMFGSGS